MSESLPSGQMEARLRALSQNRALPSYNRRPSDVDGDEGDRRQVHYKGDFYLAVKMQNKWRYFKEDALS